MLLIDTNWRGDPDAPVPFRPADEEGTRVGQADGDKPWYGDYENILILLRYLAEVGEDAATLVQAAEAPWRFTGYFDTASNPQVVTLR